MFYLHKSERDSENLYEFLSHMDTPDKVGCEFRQAQFILLSTLFAFHWTASVPDIQIFSIFALSPSDAHIQCHFWVPQMPTYDS